MQPYRFFFMTAAGRIVSAEVAECADDDAAMVKGRELLAAHPTTHAIEVWNRARRVGTIEHD